MVGFSAQERNVVNFAIGLGEAFNGKQTVEAVAKSRVAVSFAESQGLDLTGEEILDMVKRANFKQVSITRPAFVDRPRVRRERLTIDTDDLMIVDDDLKRNCIGDNMSLIEASRGLSNMVWSPIGSDEAERGRLKAVDWVRDSRRKGLITGEEANDFLNNIAVLDNQQDTRTAVDASNLMEEHFTSLQTEFVVNAMSCLLDDSDCSAGFAMRKVRGR